MVERRRPTSEDRAYDEDEVVAEGQEVRPNTDSTWETLFVAPLVGGSIENDRSGVSTSTVELDVALPDVDEVRTQIAQLFLDDEARFDATELVEDDSDVAA